MARSFSTVHLASQFTTNLRHRNVLYRTVLMCERYTSITVYQSVNTQLDICSICIVCIALLYLVVVLSILSRARVRNSVIL